MWHVAVESWQWIHQVAAFCSVILGSRMTCRWISPVAALCNVTGGSGMTCHGIRANVCHIGILPYHRSRHAILHQSAKFLSKSDHPRYQQKKWRHVDFQDGGSQPSWNLGVQWWDRWKAHVRHVVNRDHSFNLLRFWKKSRFCNLATDRQTNKQTDKQMVTPVAWSRSRCRERRLKNLTAVINMT